MLAVLYVSFSDKAACSLSILPNLRMISIPIYIVYVTNNHLETDHLVV